jgi:hypothetical protein
MIENKLCRPYKNDQYWILHLIVIYFIQLCQPILYITLIYNNWLVISCQKQETLFLVVSTNLKTQGNEYFWDNAVRTNLYSYLWEKVTQIWMYITRVRSEEIEILLLQRPL